MAQRCSLPVNIAQRSSPHNVHNVAHIQRKNSKKDI